MSINVVGRHDPRNKSKCISMEGVCKCCINHPFYCMKHFSCSTLVKSSLAYSRHFVKDKSVGYARLSQKTSAFSASEIILHFKKE